MSDHVEENFSGLNIHAQDIFLRFPSPLALVTCDGLINVNARFEQQLDRACLQSATVRDLMRNPGQPWQTALLPSRSGADVHMQVQALRLADQTLLVFDESPTPVYDTELAQLQARITELEHASSTDHLTGAWNRAHLDRVIESELGRSSRFRQPLSLALLDIDHFKRINDTYGHQTGDMVLHELVAVIRNSIRSADVLFRWGGEEFVVLAASTGYRNAQVLAEKLRVGVAAHDFAGVGTVTVSVGVAEHTGSESAAAWFQRLDTALYAAKNGGRNRVVTDAHGNSDLWAWESGLSALHLAWSESYESGNPQIDAEHRELFALANTLIDTALGEHDPGAALDNLLEHIRRHFADEEMILAEYRYARLDAHKAAHAALLKKAGELKQAAVRGEVTAGAIVEFLAKDVVARHLFTADRDFFPLFSAKGRKQSV